MKYWWFLFGLFFLLLFPVLVFGDAEVRTCSATDLINNISISGRVYGIEVDNVSFFNLMDICFTSKMVGQFYCKTLNRKNYVGYIFSNCTDNSKCSFGACVFIINATNQTSTNQTTTNQTNQTNQTTPSPTGNQSNQTNQTTGNQTTNNQTLTVVSIPSSANLYVDGIYKGLTPYNSSGLSVGNHGVLVTKSGYNSYTITKYIYVGSNSLNVTLIPLTITNQTMNNQTGNGTIITPSRNTTTNATNTTLLLSPPFSQKISFLQRVLRFFGIQS